MSEHDSKRHQIKVLPLQPEKRFTAIGFVGPDYILEFIDDYGRVYRGRGERPSLAWASIEQQMHAGCMPRNMMAQEGRAA